MYMYVSQYMTIFSTCFCITITLYKLKTPISGPIQDVIWLVLYMFN